MGLRLVLVSVVASLGVSLPSAEEVGAWKGAARCWVNDQLASWTRSMPDGEDAFASAPATEPQAPTASKVEADAVADARPEAAPAPAETRPEPAADAVAASNVEKPGSPDAAFDAAQADVVALFVADLPPARGAPPEAPENLYESLAYAMNSVAEGLEAAPANVAQPEPTPVVDAGGAADETPDGPSSSRSAQWSQAVRLTREAVFAWSRLLHAPAVVTIED